MANQYADALYKAINTIANDATQDLAAKLPEYFVGKIIAAASGDTTGYVVQILGSSREYECSASSAYKVNDVVMVQTNGSTHTIIGYAEQPFELQKFFNFYYDAALKCYDSGANDNLLTAQIRCGGDMVWFSTAVKSGSLTSDVIENQKLQVSIFKDSNVIIEKYITINDIEGNPYDIDDTLKYKIEIPKEYLDLTSSYSINFTSIGGTTYFSSIQAWAGKSDGSRFNYEVGFKLKAKTITQQNYTDRTSLTINYNPSYRITYDVKAGLEIGGIDLFSLTGSTVSNLTYYIADRPLPTGQDSIQLNIDTYRGSDPTEIKATADWTLGAETWHLQAELPVKVINYPELWIERNDSGTGLKATLKIDGDSVPQPTYEPWSEPTGSEASWLPRVQYNWKCTNPDTIVENGGPEFTPTGSQETDLTKWECSAFANSNINSPSEAFNDYIGTAQLAVGEKGDKGDTVRTIEAFYQKSTSTIPTAPTSGAPPTGNWTTTEPTVSSINKYIFKSTTTLTNDTIYGDWTTPILYQQYVSNGTSATNYYIIANHDSLHRDATGSYEESSITFSAYSKTGSNAAISASVWWSWEYGSGSSTITGGPTGTFNSLAFDIGSGTGKIQPEQQLLVKILLTRTATVPLAQIVIPVEAVLPEFIKDWDGKSAQLEGNHVIAMQAAFGDRPTGSPSGFTGVVLGSFINNDSDKFSGIIGLFTPSGTNNVAQETFRLDAQDGSIIARKGEIAGWTIKSDRLIAGTDSTFVGISPTGDYAFWAGSPTGAKAPFRVTHDGKVYANDVKSLYLKGVKLDAVLQVAPTGVENIIVLGKYSFKFSITVNSTEQGYIHTLTGKLTNFQDPNGNHITSPGQYQPFIIASVDGSTEGDGPQKKYFYKENDQRSLGKSDWYFLGISFDLVYDNQILDSIYVPIMDDYSIIYNNEEMRFLTNLNKLYFSADVVPMKTRNGQSYSLGRKDAVWDDGYIEDIFCQNIIAGNNIKCYNLLPTGGPTYPDYSLGTSDNYWDNLWANSIHSESIKPKNTNSSLGYPNGPWARAYIEQINGKHFQCGYLSLPNSSWSNNTYRGFYTFTDIDWNISGAILTPYQNNDNYGWCWCNIRRFNNKTIYYTAFRNSSNDTPSLLYYIIWG